MSVFLTPNAKQQFFTDSGAPAAGYKLYTYAHGTSYATPLATYANADGSTANANPIVLDSRGEAVLYLTAGSVYDYVLKDADGTTKYTRDGVQATTGDAAQVTFTSGATDAVPRTQASKNADTISLKDFGAKGDGETDDTDAIQAAIDYANSNTAKTHPRLKAPAGRYMFTKLHGMRYMRLVGEGRGTSHSNAGATSNGYQTEFWQIDGTNDHGIVFDVDSTNDSTGAISDVEISNICWRSNWAGPGDTDNTTGSPIYFDGAYPTQGCRFADNEFHNWAGSCIKGNVIPLPGIFSGLYGRYINGSIIDFTYSAGRGTHLFMAEDIEGDFMVGPLVKLDATARIATTSCAAEAIILKGLKHEIDSSADSTTAFCPNTIELVNMSRATVTVIGANAEPSDPLGGGTPATNAIVKLSGTTAPFLTMIGCRMGSDIATDDYLIDDQVRNVQIPKTVRNCRHYARDRSLITAVSASDVIEDTRVQSETTGVADDFARWQRYADGRMVWGDGAGSTDTDLKRFSANVLGTNYALRGKRIVARGGTALAATDFALSSGWGTGATVAVDTTAGNENNCQRFRITVTAGSASFSARPTITLTNNENVVNGQAWSVPPAAVAGMGSASTGTVAHITAGAKSVATLVLTYEGTPTSGSTYIIDCILMG